MASSAVIQAKDIARVLSILSKRNYIEPLEWEKINIPFNADNSKVYMLLAKVKREKGKEQFMFGGIITPGTCRNLIDDQPI